MRPATATVVRWTTRLFAWIFTASAAFVGMAWATSTTLGALIGTDNADAFVVAPAGPPEPLPEAPPQPADDGFEPSMPPAPVAPAAVAVSQEPVSAPVPQTDAAGRAPAGPGPEAPTPPTTKAPPSPAASAKAPPAAKNRDEAGDPTAKDAEPAP
ncbi:MAG: hypothetical protein RLZZ383_1544 [Pseudomonadota bacterium]|jgi:hypothetical protein